MLVISDNATRYLEAIPLKTIDAKQVAQALIQFFFRIEISSTILAYQGTNFMARLIKDIYHLLGVKPIRTSQYHPQIDGLVQQFNQILK